jgi:hypothetical protein
LLVALWSLRGHVGRLFSEVPGHRLDVLGVLLTRTRGHDGLPAHHPVAARGQQLPRY